MKKPLSLRPTSTIFLQAAGLANQLSERAVAAAAASKKSEDKMQATDISFASKRFAMKAEKAAVVVVGLRNDGTLRAYHEQFDKVFKYFCSNVPDWESELDRIEKASKA